MIKYTCLDTRDIHRVDCDWLIHLAPGDCTDLIAMLEKTDIKHVLFVSSGSVYDIEPTENCIEKQRNEDLFLKSDLPVNIARCFTFTGGGVCQKPLAIGKMIRTCLDKRPFNITNPFSVRTYMYMTDMVQWLMTILLADKGNVFDVGSDEQINMRGLAKKITYKLPTQFYIFLDDKFREDDPRPNYIPNLAPAKELGLKVTVGLDEAIDKTIEWERMNAS